MPTNVFHVLDIRTSDASILNIIASLSRVMASYILSATENNSEYLCNRTSSHSPMSLSDQIGWINSAFATAEAKSASRESYTSSMVYKLQLFIQEINGSLEETAQHVISTLPRLLSEVESLEDDAHSIKADLNKAKKSLAVDQDNASTVEKLTRMHAIKERMELYYKSRP